MVVVVVVVNEKKEEVVVVERFLLLCFVTIPPSIPIKEVHPCLHFSLFIVCSNHKFQDMEILKIMTMTLKVNTHLKALHLAKKWNHPKRKRST